MAKGQHGPFPPWVGPQWLPVIPILFSILRPRVNFYLGILVGICSVDNFSLTSKSLISKDGKEMEPVICVDHIPLDGVLTRRENMKLCEKPCCDREQDSWYTVRSQAAPSI